MQIERRIESNIKLKHSADPVLFAELKTQIINWNVKLLKMLTFVCKMAELRQIKKLVSVAFLRKFTTTGVYVLTLIPISSLYVLRVCMS